MKKIGLLLEKEYYEDYILTFIEDILKNDIEVVFIFDRYQKSFYDLAMKVEAVFYKESFTDIKSRFSCRFLYLDEVDEEFDLFLSVDFSYQKVKEHSLLKLSKDGILYMDFSKKAAFWEIYNYHDSLGFALIYENKSFSTSLLEGKIATFRSVTQTKNRLFNESLFYLKKFFLSYLEGKEFEKREFYISDKIEKTPSLMQYILYSIKLLKLYFLLFFKRIVLKKHSRFFVGFEYIEKNSIKLSKAKVIKTPPFHFYADPFVWSRDNKDICFLEDFDYKSGVACISAVELFKDSSYKLLGEVLKEPFHLSFPYLFEYKGELFMVPESSGSKSIRVYRCVDFPLKWEFEKELIKDINTADTMIFEKDGKWWLLTNMATKGNFDQSAQLFVFYSDDPLSSNWTPHPKNPVVFDSSCGRNGGIYFEKDRIFRVRQRQKYSTYGAEFSIAKITKLDEQEYEEIEIKAIKPDFFQGISATHHLHKNKNIAVFDFMRYERIDI